MHQTEFDLEGGEDVAQLKRFVSFAVACIILFATDTYLFLNGKSWTFLQYESALPFLLIGQKRYSSVKVISLSFLIISTKILFYEFGLTFNLIRESLFGSLVLASTATALVISSFKDAFKNIKLTLLGLAVFLGTALIDKNLAGDKLFSSYLLPQMKIGQKPYPSANPLRGEIVASFAERGSILIVWESLGWPKDMSAIASFKKQNPTVKIQRVDHEGGSTLTGEMRYLCGSNSGVMNYADCVPHQGFSVAFHGNTLNYFQRQTEYQKMGFNQLYGRQELGELPLCHYAYNAVCDSDLIDQLIKTASEHQCKGLFYAMTIDSHFPFEKYTSFVPGILRDVSGTLAKLKQIKQEFPDCNIVVIGDHPPPVSTEFDPRAVMRIDVN